MVEWPTFGNGPDNTKYSALDQIDHTNFHELQVAWEWESVSTGVADANKAVKPGQFKPVPIMLDGVLYVATAVAQAAAIDAATGEALWSYDPESWRAGRPANIGFQHRGVAAWRGSVEQDGRSRNETRISGFRMGPLFTPPSTSTGVLMLPSAGGGANWPGAAVDPDTGVLYVPSSTRITVHPLNKPDPARSNLDYVGSFFASLGEVAEDAGLDLTEEELAAVAAERSTPRLVALALP